MNHYIIISCLFICSCVSTIPEKYELRLERISKELNRTRLIARRAVGRISKLEHKLSESIIERDSLLIEHKKETSLLRASDAFHKGNNALLTKNYNKAILYYQKTIVLRPTDAHALNNLGNAYKEIKNYPLAINAYRNAILLKPDYASAHYNLGIVYQKSNNLDVALDSYRKAARLAHSGGQKWLKESGYYW
jgi:tetratricopeptide (TPR) repeat protein